MPAAPAIVTRMPVRAEVPANLLALLPVRHAIADALSDLRWERDEAMRVLVAAVEGLVNAVEHDSAGGGRVTVRFDITAERAELWIADDGRPGVRPPTLDPGLPADDATCGRGLLLMLGLADAMTCRANGRGTELWLAFDRPRVAGM
jgi:anti-sigma regulatory factor (Ser/Thr protein kinase)